MKTEQIERVKNNIRDQQTILEFLESDPIPFETNLNVYEKEYMYIGMGGEVNLTKKYNISMSDIYSIDTDGRHSYLRSGNFGFIIDTHYFVKKELFDDKRENFIPKKKGPIEGNLRIVNVKDKTLVSIGYGEDPPLMNKYGIDAYDIYLVYGDFTRYNYGYWGGCKDTEYWVEIGFYMDNIEKFQKKPNYKVVERDGVRFVSIGYGNKECTHAKRYKIDTGDIYQLDWADFPYNAGWTGGLEDVEYYVKEEFYRANIEKFQQQ